MLPARPLVGTIISNNASSNPATLSNFTFGRKPQAGLDGTRPLALASSSSRRNFWSPALQSSTCLCSGVTPPRQARIRRSARSRWNSVSRPSALEQLPSPLRPCQQPSPQLQTATTRFGERPGLQPQTAASGRRRKYRIFLPTITWVEADVKEVVPSPGPSRLWPEHSSRCLLRRRCRRQLPLRIPEATGAARCPRRRQASLAMAYPWTAAPKSRATWTEDAWRSFRGSTGSRSLPAGSRPSCARKAYCAISQAGACAAFARRVPGVRWDAAAEHFRLPPS